MFKCKTKWECFAGMYSIEQIQHTITQINYQLTLVGQLVLFRTFNKSFTARKETESIECRTT